MSYYKMKYFSIKKDGSIFVTVAASNVRPIKYFCCEYAATVSNVREKLCHLAKDIWSGEIQPLSSCPRRSWWIACQNAVHLYDVKFTSFTQDFRLHVNRWNDLQLMICSDILAPMYFGEQPSAEALAAIRAYDSESAKIYEAKEKEYAEKGIVVARSALYAEYLIDTTVVLSEDNRVYLCHRDQYKDGLMDNSEGSAIDITDWGKDAFDVFWHGKDPAGVNIPWDYLDAYNFCATTGKERA